MQQTTERPKPPESSERGLDLTKALSTRNGTLLVATISALLAGGLLLVFLDQYRDSTAKDEAAATVLVAKRLIEQGSSGDVLASERMFRTVRVPRGELKQGAIVDPSTVKGRVTVADIYPGEQLTAGRFARSSPRALNKLTGASRAIALPTDPVHGITAELRAGDRVDVLVGLDAADGEPLIKPLMRNVLVLGTAGSEGKQVIVRAPDSRAADLAFAADHGRLWLVLRPQAGARDSQIPTVTKGLLLGQEGP